MFLSDLAQSGKLRATGIGEHNIELAFLPFALREEAIEIARVRHVPFYAGYIFSNLLYRRPQLSITASRDEDVRAFVHELLRGGRSMPLLPPVMSAIFPSSLPMTFSVELIAGAQ